MAAFDPGEARIAMGALVSPYEVTLPRVAWLREQSYVNAQSLQPVKFTEFIRKAPGKFDTRVSAEVEAAIKRWLML